MKIGLFTDSYPPFINGVSTSVEMLKKALEQKRHTVYIVTVGQTALKYDYDEKNRVLRIPGVPVGIYDYRLSRIYPLKVINQIKTWHLDIIHSHTEFGIGIFARLFAKQESIPLVHTYHTMYEDYTHYITKGYFDKSSKKVVEYLTMFYCDKTACELIVPTEKTYRLFKEKYHYDKPINIIPTGMDVERFFRENLQVKKLSGIRKEMKIKANDFVILFVGRIAEEKNIPFLFRVMKKIAKQAPHAKLYIIGDGPDKGKYEKYIIEEKLQEKVIFIGKVPFNEMPYYYNVADLFVTASKTETQGLTVIEAMASSVPVFAINDEAFRNVIVDGLNGRLFETEEELEEAIIEVYKDSEQLEKMSLQARIQAEHSSLAHFAESALEVYQRAIKDYHSRKNFTTTVLNMFKKGKDK